MGKTSAFNECSLDAPPHARRCLSDDALLVEVDADDAHRPGRVPRVARDVLAAQPPVRVVVLDYVADLLRLARRPAAAPLADVALNPAPSLIDTK